MNIYISATRMYEYTLTKFTHINTCDIHHC